MSTFTTNEGGECYTSKQAHDKKGPVSRPAPFTGETTGRNYLDVWYAVQLPSSQST